MLWSNIGNALGQRRSTHEKLKSIMRVVVVRDGGILGKRRVLVPRYLSQVIFVPGHQGKPGKPPSSGLRLAHISLSFRMPAPPLRTRFLQ